MKKKVYPLFYGGKKQQFARSVVVGDIVFLSGSSGRTMETGDVSSNNLKDQMVVAWNKIKGALEEAGSSLENIVKTNIYLKNRDDYDIMRQTKNIGQNMLQDYLESPASTFMQPVSLSRPNMLVEIEVIAVISSK